ncbi:glycosyltransferase family 4 protein [Chloroflexota bacterium]
MPQPEQIQSYRVLLVLLSQTFGGAEVRVLTQARAMQELGHECHVAVLADSPLHKRLQIEQLPYVTVTAGRGDPRLLFQLRQLMQQGDYQIVDAHNVQSILWGHDAALVAGVPGRVSTIHSDYGSEYPGLKGRAYEGVLRLNRLMSKQYITVTETLQEKAVRQGIGERSTLIHNAVPVPPDPLAQRSNSLRPTWGFTPADFVVAIIARLKPVKGHTYLLGALASLPDLPQLKLLVVGDGPLQETLQNQAQALRITDRVTFTGFCDNIPEILQTVDAVCLASLSEALPYAVLEAASYARPLLVTKVGGLATLLADGETAVLAAPRDPATLADGLRWLATHPAEAQAMGLAAYEMVRQSFSVDRMMNQILQVYEKALS